MDMVTVLMATWQGERFLEEQLESVLNQSHPVNRLLISDDGSTDGTLDILRAYQQTYPEHISIMECPKKESFPGSGAAHNFFRLFAKAASESGSGEDYYFLCDQDDVWKTDKVEKMIRIMREKERIMGNSMPIMLFSDAEVVDGGRTRKADSFFAYQRLNPYRTKFSEVLSENPVTGGAAVMNRALLMLVSEEPECCVMHDWWLALLASSFGGIFPVGDALYEYRQHGDNTLGAVRTGGLRDLCRRAGRGDEVAENYRRMFRQADSLFRMYGAQMTRQNQEILRAYLALPMKSAAGRLMTVCRHHFWKSSVIQTLAMCLTIPGPE